MKFSFNELVISISNSLDLIEHEFVGVSENHGKRVAYLSYLLGQQYNLSKTELSDLVGLAMLHDCALLEASKNQSETLREMDREKNDIISSHCISGEKNVSLLNFKETSRNAILYHHENADGSGPFKKTAEQTPLYAQIIHIADITDVRFDFSSNTLSLEAVSSYLEAQKNRLFSEELILKLLNVLNEEVVNVLKNKDLVKERLVSCAYDMHEITDEECYKIGDFFATIIDYKSNGTAKHSLGLAQKSAQMGKYYHYDAITNAKLYLAGAIHDVGKLVVSNEILHKPDRLTIDEYRTIQNHAYGTYVLLSNIHGLEDVVSWACNHHEKLDGSGYPFQKSGEVLSKNDRLLAVLDIYQALTEKRVYKDGMSHMEAMGILNREVEKGKLDQSIVHDVDIVFG